MLIKALLKALLVPIDALLVLIKALLVLIKALLVLIKALLLCVYVCVHVSILLGTSSAY